ncbi:MAG TPA: branched-chain amino acid ABC transporter permease [Acidimicrobiales bacterium]|nr:branched-chain amino acid ABC transporter permease [Acidimicrobiales bacterium]
MTEPALADIPAAAAPPVHPTAAAPARRLPRRTAVGAVSVLAVLLPFVVGRYWLSQLVFVLIVAIGALGLDVLTGRTGQISLGHSFFLAVGAYTAGIIGGRYGLTAALWIPAAGVVAGLLGAVVGPTALRLRGLYLAIVTIGLVFIGQWIFVNVTWISGGPGGESLPVPRFGYLDFASGERMGSVLFDRNKLYYYLALILLALGMAFVYNFGRSRSGLSMYAVRDREVAAAVMGVDVSRTKVKAFVIASALAGVGGALYGSFLSFVEPTQWDLSLSIQYVVVIVVGGMASVWGPLLGSLFVVGLPALLNQVSGSLPFLATGTHVNGVISPTDASTIVYGVVLVVFLLGEPRGVVGLAARVGRLVGRVPAGRAPLFPEQQTPAGDLPGGDRDEKGAEHGQ